MPSSRKHDYADHRAANDPRARAAMNQGIPPQCGKLLALGFAIFPIQARGKKPFTPHGVHDATRDLARIAEWARQWPGCNWGAACGRPSGICVLDFDSPDALAGFEREHGKLPETYTIRTKRGFHFYFRLPQGGAPNRPFEGGELRAEGYYVVAEGSTHPDGPVYVAERDTAIVELPTALLEHFQARPAIEARADAPIQEGQRNTTLASLAGTMRRRGMACEAIAAALHAENAARCFPPLPHSEVEKIAASVARYDPGPEEPQDETERRIESLSMLSRVEYDRVREKEAQELGIRVSTLDAEVQERRLVRQAPGSDGQGQTLFLADPQPWNDAVNGDDLLRELEGLFLAHLTMPPGASETSALWSVFSHAHDAFQVSPLLAVTSPEKNCGKSTLLALLSVVVRKPLLLSNITSASLFRTVEMFIPTLLIDEGDTILADDEGLRGILNSGWLRSQAKVIRNVGDDHEPRLFSTWGPKAIAMIGSLPSTLADRSVEMRMCRQTPEEESAKRKLRMDKLGDMEHLRRKAWRWVRDNLEALRKADPKVPEGFTNRLADNWRPLLAVADVAGGQWPKKARDAARMLSATKTDESLAIVLLGDLQCLFIENHVDRLSSAGIVAALGAMEDRPWPEYSHGKPITKRGLAKILSRFGVGPKTVRFGTRETSKGYLRQELEESFRRFLPPLACESVTPSEPAAEAAPMDFQNVTMGVNVTDGDSQKPASNGRCDDVTFSKPHVSDSHVPEKRFVKGEL